MVTDGSDACGGLAPLLVLLMAIFLVMCQQAACSTGEYSGPVDKPLYEEDFAWVRRSSPPGVVTSVCAVPQGRAWATTRDSIYSFDGRRWKEQFEEPDGEGRAFTCVSGRNGRCAWAVSAKTTGDGDLASRIYSFDGRSWRPRGAPEASIVDVTALSASSAWAVGTKVEAGNARGGAYLFDGRSWRERLDVPEPLKSVSAADSACIWAVGERGGIYHFDGNGWALRQKVDARLNGVSSLNRSRAYACGYKGSGGARSVVYLFDGKRWRSIGSFSSGGDGMLAVSAQEPYDAWAVDGKSMYHYNGSFWRVQYHVPREFRPACVASASGSGVWIASAAGGLFKRVNVSDIRWMFPREVFR